MIESNPCDAAQKSVVKVNKTRRPLSVHELQTLFRVAPEPRRTAYVFLALTGLRRAEAKQVTWDHLHLDTANAHIDLDPSMTKNGKAESLPLVPELVTALLKHRSGRTGERLVFAAIPSMEMFRKDLAAAGIDTDPR